ncbi:shikimate dehydrogenase [Microvirga antarctica]|uniref:shikimate dehydrogenase n=1 Tax=Microvirga antarctica TaxID=2819233 RepID=UPI001B317ACC|nr:shikimate dehydrogenase [Microvirga antarctica]
MIKAFVVGHPIRHSRSPLIHGHWIGELGLAGSYERIDVPPAEFKDFLTSLSARGFAGGNVTIPHKEAAFATVARRTARAERIGAVNTVWLEDGVLWGDNTDAAGFVDNLVQSVGTNWAASVDTALVIGAGGAARAVVAGLQDCAMRRILVVNRTTGKADALVQDLAREGGPALVSATWEALPALVPQAGLIVNTTSLGMTRQPPLDLDLSSAKHDAIVADLIYAPLKTALLRDAEKHGLRIVGGLGMLLHQAVPGFARWFGVTPQVTPALEAVILRDLSGN